ncbi:hypothetical protein FH5T_06865 [Draconibacterium orientale]|uniref:HYR domain-containing protein n=1 Tax=Draconibacterium orientale TaxID=1168034 RepID=A0ABM5QDA4_9BACT|nr:HYR domain-containing protein [Draconibacterium orientale]AHW61708.1 hypothetical protein FH5T_06865 [Draconibacterium orientale]
MAVLTFTMDVKSLSWESYVPDLYSELGEAEFLSKSVDAHSLFPANTLYDDTTGIICPEDIALYTDLNSCVAVINAGLNVTDPNSIISSLSWEMTGATEATSNGFGINQIGSYTFNEGTTVVTYRGATLYNNSINCTFTVTVTDNQAPRLISSPGHITVRNLPGECYANVSWTEPSAVDNCVPPDQLIYTSNYSSGQQFPVGSTRVEYRISDGVNTAFHSFTVTVIDAEAPEMIAPLAMESECGKPVPDAFTTWEQFEQAGGSANDNCSVNYGSFRYVGQTSSGITCPYTVTRIYSISDNDGNVSEVKHVIEVIGEGMAYEATVEATEPEVLLEPGAETQAEILFSKTDVSCKGSRTGVVDLTVNGTSGIVNFVWSTQNGSGIVQGAEDQSTLSDGDYTVMVYEDGVRLLAFDFSILVVDNQAPVLNAPENIQRNCGQYIPSAYSTWSDFANAGGTVSDNCQLYYSSFRLASEAKSNPDCPYTLTRVYEITDVNGNRGVAEHLITVEAEDVILKSGMADCTASSGNWSNPAIWSCGKVPTSLDNVIIPDGVTVTVDVAAVCNNITIESGGELNHGVNLSTTVQVYGDWTNNGTYDGGTNGVVEFTGPGSATISGTTEFEGLIVNKDDGLSSLLTINGGVNVLSSGLLTMTSGLITIPGGSSFSVNPSIGLDIEYEAGFDVTGGSLATGDFTITNEGLIRIAAGSNVTLGDDSGNEVHTQFDGAFIVTGGDVDIAGRLYNSASGTLDPDGLNLTSGITISSGTVTLCTLGNKASSTGSLQVTSAGNFEFSGGTIVFQNPSTATSELDLGLIDGTGTKNITGGTFQFGNALTPNGSIFHIDSEIKIPNIVTYSGSALFLDMPVDGASIVECIDQATEPTPPVVQDNCGYEITPIVPSGYQVTSYDGCEGDVPYTYTYEDCDGSSHDWVFTYTIKDVTNPTASGPITVDLECADDLPAAATTIAGFLALTGADAADNCTAQSDVVVTSVDNTTGAGSCSGVITRTYTIEDECGNTVSVDHVFTVTDNTNPTATAPATVDLECADDKPAAATTIAGFLALPGAAAADNCTATANLTVSSNDVVTTPGSCNGVITRTYTIEDECGNTVSVDHVFTETDNEDPTAFNPLPITVQCAADVPAPDITVVTDGADNCTANPVVAFVSDVSDGNSCPEIITRTYSVTDDCNNSIQVTQMITINDNILPTWTTTANNLDRTIECSDGSGLTAAQALAPVASDNCAGTISYTKNSGVFVPVAPGSTEGTYTNTWTAADACGNSTAAVFTQVITIVDNTPPTITCPGNLTANTPLGTCGAVVTYTTPVGADNCAGATTVQTTGLPSGSTFPVGVTTNTFEVTDAAGNTNSCSFTVTVTDNRKPVLTLPATAIIACHESTHPDNTGWATATDNCAVDELSYTDSYGPPAVNCVDNYTIYREWLAVDIHGNQSSATQEIKVSDVTGPEVVFANQIIEVNCPDDIPGYYENLDQFLASNSLNQVNDLCSGSVTMQLYDEYSFFDPLAESAGYCPDSVSRVYRFYDECLNYTELEQKIIVTDLLNCSCTECTDEVVVYDVDLRPDPDSIWAEYKVRKDKNARCCLDDVWWEEGGNDPYRCVSFNVIIDNDAVGVQIKTSKGQDAKEWRIDCENVSLEGPDGNIICLPSGEYHLFTHCKQGADPIDYEIRSVRGIIESGDIETRVDCSREIHTTGDFESVPVWSALNPLYDKYLDTSDPYNPIFFVPLEDKDDVPSSIQYQVCADVNGYICGQAADGTICDTITVNVYDPIETLIDLGDVVMCAGTPIDVEPVISPAGNYTIEWFEGTGAIGTPIHTGYIHTIETPGWYSVKITEYESGLPCNESTSDFEVVLDLSKPGLSAPPDTLFLSCDDPNADQKIIDWRESAWAFIVDAYGDTVTIDVEDNYNTSGGINLVCNEVLDVEFKAVDPCSNDSIDIATIVVIDTTPPIITPASNSIADCNTLDHNTHEGYLAWLANHGGATASDNCQDPATLIWSDNMATAVWEGNGARDSITVTFTVTDDCDNSASTTATFIIVDDIPPVIECPPNVQDTAAENYCSKVPGNLQDPVYSDECSVPRLTWTSTGALVSAGDGTVAGIAFPVGVTVVTYTVTDDAGLTASCSFSVRIVDVTQPNIEIEGCQDVSETMGPDECYVIPTTINDPVYSDDCWPLSSLVLSYTITGALNDAGTGSVRGKQFPVGVSTVEYTVTDPDGNSASCSFTVTMLRTDIPPAVISCPDSPEAVYATAGNCDAPVDLDSPTIDDPCATATYTISNDYNGTTNADDVYPVGITTVIWTITDNSGNETTCTQLVEVIDNQPPTITCQGDVEDLITDGGCDLESSLVTPPTYSDNCPNPVLTYVLTFEDGSTFSGTGSAHTYAFPVGKTQIHYTVTDAAGLIAECSYTVWIKNLDAPQFQVDCDVAIDVSVTSEAGQCGANVSPVPPGIINPCNEVYSIVNSFTGTADASGFYPVGNTTVTWTIIDASGTEYTCEQLVEVIDLPPFVNCPGDYEYQADFNLPYRENITVADPTYGDNCPNPVLEWTLVEPDGTTYTSATTGINILPNPRRYYVGVTTISYKITDSSGLTDDCSFTVTVTGPPDITCPPTYEAPTDQGVCTATLNSTDHYGLPVLDEGVQPITWTWTITDPDGTEGATGTFVASEATPGPPDIGDYPFKVGTSTISWRAENISGFDECEHLVIVTDKEPPVITADPYENCVDPLHWATYNESDPTPQFGHVDPNLIKSPIDYRTLIAGDTDLDLTSLTDNCCDSLSMISKLQWRIEFVATPDPVTGTALSHPDISGTGQPSDYAVDGVPKDIYLWGDGVTFKTVTHNILYWIEDCNGNPVTEELRKEITITPRPQVIKTDY